MRPAPSSRAGDCDWVRDEQARLALAASFARWEGHLRDGLRSMQANGKLEPNADPDELATATIAAVQGGQLLSQTRRDSGQLAIVLDAAYAHLRAHAAWPGLARAVS
jgi:hypothetical protein